MSSALKHSPWGYFRYFYAALGNKLLFNLLLAVILGLMDGIGLALFIPLLQFVNGADAAVDGEAMGGMSFIVKAFDLVGVSLNLFSVLALMVIIFTLKGVLNYRLLIEQVVLRQLYMIKLRLNQIKNLKQLSFQGFLKLDAGTIQNAITTEIGRNIQALIYFLSSLKTSIILTSYVALAFIANWQFAIFVMVGGGLSNFIYKKITESVKSSSIEISRRGNLFNSYIIQAVYNFKYLKATNYFSNFAIKLENVINEVQRLNWKIGRSQAITSSTREPVIIFVVAFVILLQVNVLGGSLGSILLSLLLFYRALNGLVMVQMTWQTFMQNVGGLQSISDLQTSMQAEVEHHPKLTYQGFSEQIALSSVSFSYGKREVLSNIDMLIPKNKTVALIGESGSGKSTLANIITTLMPPAKGQMLVDGQDVYQYNLNSFRSRIGYITQEPVIFSDSIYNNVTFWAEPTAENLRRFWEVISKVSLLGFVEGLEQREHTLLGDNGMLVSGGQKQRISIARELFKQVDILILDEATSALDTETERFIQESIEELQGEYTMIVIAHRLSTIRNADRIYLLEQGRVSASGNYDELLSASERFQKIVSLQLV